MYGSKRTGSSSQFCKIGTKMICKCLPDCDEHIPIRMCKTGFLFRQMPGMMCCPKFLVMMCNLFSG